MHKFLPPAVFVIVSIICLGMTAVVHNAGQVAVKNRFEVVANEVVNRISERVSQHVAFLVATRSFFEANDGNVSKTEFKTFIDGLGLKTEFRGVLGIGYARLIRAGPDAEAEIAAGLLADYNITRQVWPETDQVKRTPIVLLEPNDARNAAALGYDMFSNGIRRTAMLAAAAIGGAHASAPVKLVQEITTEKQAGFLVYVPVRKRDENGAPGVLQGFVYAPFRAGDLHMDALDRFPQPPVVVETIDTNSGESTPLFRSNNYDAVAANSSLEIHRSFDVAGRTWMMTIHETQAFRSTINELGTVTLTIISLLLAGALAISTRFQLVAVDSARKLQALSEKSLQDKDMMLQEMKHRIKNSIARVLAIARQSAAHAETIDEFSKSFSSRLQAMAHAQDMLTRSHWQRGDLGELLNKELQQVFGKSPGDCKVSGPTVELSERATQALGLTFHELATNAMKYGGISEEDGDLSVHWRLQGSGKKKLVLDWIETSGKSIDEPGKSGFGTRLIDANIKGELGGTIERTFGSEGMSIRITVPME